MSEPQHRLPADMPPGDRPRAGVCDRCRVPRAEVYRSDVGDIVLCYICLTFEVKQAVEPPKPQ
jgi:hypothetical protein